MLNKFDSKKIERILSLIGLALFIVLLHWNSYNMPFERDEGEYAYSARVLLDGGLPYRDSFMQKPPMIIYTYAMAELLDPDPFAVWPPRALLSITIFFIALLVRYVVKKEYGAYAGTASMYLIVPMLSLFYISALAANTEIFMLLPLVGVVALYVKHRQNNLASPYVCFFAGFLAVTSLLYKPIALFTLLFLFTHWMLQIWNSKKNYKLVFKSFMYMFMGGLASTAIFLGYFLLNDGGRAFWENAVAYNMSYIKEIGSNNWTFLYNLKLFLYIWWPLFILTFISLFSDIKKLYIGLLSSSVLAVIYGPQVHYVILLMPFWVIIIASGINLVSAYFEKKFLTELPHQKQKKSILAILIIIILLIMLSGGRRQFFISPEELSLLTYGKISPFIESKIIAKKIELATLPSDYVYIAGSEPQILYYSDRKSSSRFVISYPLTINTPVRLQYQQEVIRDLEEKPPKAVVVSKLAMIDFNYRGVPQDFLQFFGDYLENNYTLAGGYVLQKNSGLWKESLTDEDISNSSLLLFIKKY